MIEETLKRLIDDLEYDGYLIGLTRTGTGYWVKMPDHAVDDECALVRFNDAKRKDPELKAALLPFLEKSTGHMKICAKELRSNRRGQAR